MDNSKKINMDAEDFKKSPLGFLLGILLKFQAYCRKNFDEYHSPEDAKNVQDLQDAIDDLKIVLSDTEELSKEKSNEGVLINALEKLTECQRQIILNGVYEYLNLLTTVLDRLSSDADQTTEDTSRIQIMEEFYSCSRLGLVLNCYFGSFENDDSYYGTFYQMLESVKTDAGNKLTSEQTMQDLIKAIQKETLSAPVDLKFCDFLAMQFDTKGKETMSLILESHVRPFCEMLFDKALENKVDETDINCLAAGKQIQRMIENKLHG